MILPDHNAHLIEISTAATPDDPCVGITGAAPEVKWQGDAWAHLEDQLEEVIRGGQNMQIVQTRIIVPQNLPYYPAINDLMTFVMMRTRQTQTLTIRRVNDRFALLGFIEATGRVA